MTQTKAELLQTRHQGDIRLGDADSTHYVGFKAPATVGTSLVWTLPAVDGTANYLLKTDGSGNLGWVADSTTDSTKMPLAGGTFTGDVIFTGDNYNVTWDKSTDDLIFNDSARAIFGTNSDGLEIFHESNNSYISDTGTGGLILLSNGTLIETKFGAEHAIKCTKDGSVELFYDNVKTCQTDANGIVVLGPEGGHAEILFKADEGDDNADRWRAQVDTSGNFKIGNYSTGSWVNGLTLDGSNNATFAANIVANSGKVLVGDTTSRTGAKLEASDTGATGSLSLRRYTANAYPSYIEFFKSRSATLGGETVVQSGDILGQITWGGSDGTNRAYAAFIQADVDGTPGDDDMPGRLMFSTSADGSASPTERLRIDSTGRVGIGSTSFNDAAEYLLVKNASTAANVSIVGSNSAHSSLNLGDEDDFNIQKIRSNHTNNSLVFFTNNATALTLDNAQNTTFAAAIYGPVKTVSALELDLSTGNYFIKTISGNSTFTFANPASSGTVTAFTLELRHSSGTVRWPSEVKWNADTAPTLTTGKTHLFMFVTDDGGSRYRGSALVDYVN